MARLGGPFAHVALVLVLFSLATTAEASFVRVPPPKIEPETIPACPVETGFRSAPVAPVSVVTTSHEHGVLVGLGAALAAVGAILGAALCGARTGDHDAV